MNILPTLLLAFVAANPSVTIKAKGAGYVATVDTFHVSDESAVGTEIDRQAAQLCAGKAVRWGKFGSVANLDRNRPEASQITGYYKEFECIDEKPAAFAAAPTDWQPSAEDQSEVRAFFERYYAKRDGGDFAAAAAMFSPAQGTTAMDLERTAEKLGPGSRRITKVTWYINPEGADRPGVFAALDFVGQYQTLHLYCGYLVLYRLRQGSYEIVREEQNKFAKNEHSPNAAELAAMRSAVCRE
jgi:hypothetical protein